MKTFSFCIHPTTHSPEVKPKRSSFRSSKKQKETTQPDDVNNTSSSLPEEDHLDSDADYEEEQPAAPIDQAGSESPRTSALRAMGGEAAQGVIDYMNTQGEQVTYEPPHEGLTTISEENELEKSQQLSVAPTITITQV